MTKRVDRKNAVELIDTDYADFHSEKLYCEYLAYVGKNLSEDVKQQDMYISHIKDISLSEFQIA